MESNYFTKINEEYIKNLFQKFDRIENKPTTVYHYTSEKSFYNILKSGQIWLSSILSLNDPNEIIFGLKCIEEFIERKSRKKNRLKSLILNLQNEILRDLYNNISNCFIFSTSAKPDDYQQWINYADNGNGLSVGLNREKIFEFINRFIIGKKLSYTYPVQYYKDSINVSDVIITNFETQIVNLLDDLVDDVNLNDVTFFAELKELLIIFSSLIKSSFHKTENEWRFFILVEKVRLYDSVEIALVDNKLTRILPLIYFTEPKVYKTYNNKEIKNKRYTFIDDIILGPKKTDNNYQLENVRILIKKYTKYFDYKKVRFSTGLLR